MLYFNKTNYKILKFIYEKDQVTERELRDKFSDDKINMFIVLLGRDGYIGGQHPDGSFVSFSEIPYSSTGETIYFTIDKGDCVIEEKQWRFRKWLYPLIISIISLIFSVIAISRR